MSSHTTAFEWGGKYQFSITGTGRHEDTLRIESAFQKSESSLTLALPTLCITYADLKFANAIGGVQENYPASAAYGPVYFDPAVEIVGEDEVERLTWIRGAHRVRIDREKTLIEWYPWRTLVIPRLRIERERGARAWLHVDDVPIEVDQPLVIKIKQLADGRHIGGIRMEKRHPKWRPPKPKNEYNLWVRVIDGESHQPLPEARVKVFHWCSNYATGYGTGRFAVADQRYTDGEGVAAFSGRPANEREAVVLDLPGWLATPRAFRPLPGQQARFHLLAWPLKKERFPYTWQTGDSLDRIAQIAGHDPADILKANRLPHATALRPRMAISLPCYMATYRLEPGDRFETLAKRFGFKDQVELAKVNGLLSVSDMSRGMEIKLPGWYFLYARRGDTLGSIEKMLGLPPGSARTVGQTYRPDPQWLYDGEVIAVHTPSGARPRPLLKRERT